MIETYDPRTKWQWYHKLTALYRKEQKELKVLNDFVLGLIKGRRRMLEAGEIRGDECMADYYLQYPIDGRMLSDEEIVFELNTMTLGMHDTTQSTAAFIMYKLAKHQDVQQKVYEEICSILDNDQYRDVTEEDIFSMGYLDAVFKETLRMYPPISYVGRNLQSEITTGGYTFPKDVDVVISPYLMGRNPKYFEDPNRFDPERFFGVENYPPAYIPFGIGAKKCIGGKMSNLSLKVSMAKILMKYQLTLPDNHTGINLYFLFMLKTEKNIMLNFNRRRR